MIFIMSFLDIVLKFYSLILNNKVLAHDKPTPNPAITMISKLSETSFSKSGMEDETVLP